LIGAFMCRKKLYIALSVIAFMVGSVDVSLCNVSGEKNMSTTAVMHKHTNRLIDESSPYLLQHAHNPVDWYPWGDEAFEQARKEDKPIFLSIGYSTCHWCHVMETESFENEQIAKIMNEHFICIKVDREHRPDIDRIYMNAVVMMTGRGGWPMSIFLMPDGKPFYGGTYFPPKDYYGRPGFERLLLSIADLWKNERHKLVDSAGKLSDLLKNPSVGQTEEKKLSPEMLKKAFNHFQKTFDTVNGGFAVAPKFPNPTILSMLLGYWHRSGDEQALQIVTKTLDAMAEGGIYDHIGGGFHRYATDRRWLVPHFEKMLYDQALLSKVYLQAYKVIGNKKYAEVSKEIFDYIMRDMTDQKGGFYSAEDADSESREGTFYLWQPKQIAAVLNKKQAGLFNAFYGVTREGNFEEGKTIIHIASSVEELGKKFKKKPKDIENILADARSKIFKERQKRIRPHRDDKVITAWNGLMISSLAYSRGVLEEEKYILAAEHSAEFILSTLYKDGRLMRYYRNGQVVEKGFLNDYAFMAMALLDLYEATFDVKWLTEAKKLTEEMVELFVDEEKGGFFLTGKDGERLITRTRSGFDGAIPSGNSIAALVLLKLGRLTMDQRFAEQGGRTLEAFAQQLDHSPANSSAMLTAVDFWLGPTQEIVIAGNADATDTERMLKLIDSKFLPNAVTLLHEQGQKGAAIEQIVPFVSNQVVIDGKVAAYVCENYICNRPVDSVDELEKLLKN